MLFLPFEWSVFSQKQTNKQPPQKNQKPNKNKPTKKCNNPPPKKPQETQPHPRPKPHKITFLKQKAKNPTAKTAHPHPQKESESPTKKAPNTHTHTNPIPQNPKNPIHNYFRGNCLKYFRATQQPSNFPKQQFCFVSFSFPWYLISTGKVRVTRIKVHSG